MRTEKQDASTVGLGTEQPEAGPEQPEAETPSEGGLAGEEEATDVRAAVDAVVSAAMDARHGEDKDARVRLRRAVANCVGDLRNAVKKLERWVGDTAREPEPDPE